MPGEPPSNEELKEKLSSILSDFEQHGYIVKSIDISKKYLGDCLCDEEFVLWGTFFKISERDDDEIKVVLKKFKKEEN
jgi:hypothetical protein